MPDSHKPDKFPLAGPGWPYVLYGLALTIMAAVLDLTVPAAILGVLTVFMVIFFRDPPRRSKAPPNAVLSPADGVVVARRVAELPGPDGGQVLLVSIFMNIFNVHVNRLPVSGRVLKVESRSGSFMPADRSQASEKNHRVDLHLELADGRQVIVSQVAGLIARHIHCDLRPGQEVRRGERYGMIRFGSRVDLYLPLGCQITKAEGSVVKAGVSVLGSL